MAVGTGLFTVTSGHLQNQGAAFPPYNDIQQPHWPQSDIIDMDVAEETALQEMQIARPGFASATNETLAQALLNQNLPEFKGEDFQSVVCCFADSYYQCANEVRLIANDYEATKGVSGALVYRVLQWGGRFVAIVKVFHKQQEFEEEIKAVSILHTLRQRDRLSESQGIIEILSLGRCFLGGEDHWLMLQSAAEGDGLDDHLKRYFSGRASTTHLEGTIRASAGVFATLHRNTASNEGSCLEAYINAIRDMLGKLDKLKPKWVGNCLEKYQEPINTLIRKSGERQGENGCIIHGDSHPGNIFASQGRITLIDTPSLARSTHPGDLMTGISPKTRDYSNFLTRTRDICIRSAAQSNKKIGVFINVKYKPIKRAFKEEYARISEPLTKEHKHLQSIRSLLGTIFRCCGNLSKHAKLLDQIKVEMAVIEYALSKIERITENYR